MDPAAWFDDNRRFWDERAPIHAASEFYDVEGFLAGGSTLEEFVVAEVGPVEGRTLFHPQCHFGLEPVEWARRGATVTGLDFSAPAVDLARDLASRAGVDVEFLCANVYDAPDAVGGRTFDVVYTGLGAINWLPDLRRWAETMAAVCRPGGVFHLVEFHPVAAIFMPDAGLAAPPLTLCNDYFDGYFANAESGTYAEPDAVTVHDRTQERDWPLGEVVTEIIEAGFDLEFLHEHRHTAFRAFDGLEDRADGSLAFPAGLPSPPMMYSLRAVRR